MAGQDPWHPLGILDGSARKHACAACEPVLPAGHEGDYAARLGTDGAQGLSNVDYAPVAEPTGRSVLARLVLNCNAPDSGNMEVLLRYGGPDESDRSLDPLLVGRSDPASR